jgi:hypothetical protein
MGGLLPDTWISRLCSSHFFGSPFIFKMVNKMLITLPIIFYARTIDFTNPVTLLGMRAAYFAILAASLLCVWIAGQKAKSANNTTKIWVPIPKQGFGASGIDHYEETTYVEHETGKVQAELKKALFGAAFMVFLTFKMEVHLPLLLQCGMNAMGVWENPLCKKHLFGLVGPDELVWKEELTQCVACVCLCVFVCVCVCTEAVVRVTLDYTQA